MKPKRWVSGLLLVLAGSILVLGALIADAFGVGRPGIGPGQLGALLLGAGVAAAGFAWWANRWPRLPILRRLGVLYRGLALTVSSTFLVLLALELAGSLLIENPHLLPGLQKAAPTRLPYYASQPWSEQHFRELKLSEKTRYTPFSLWRTAPYRGTTINIDERGVRRTPTPPDAAAPDGAVGLEVLTFGGSTMWGYGSPDDQTIAAHLQRELTQRLSRPIRVENRGERAWVSTQSLIDLIRRLQDGESPDLVVFYDGYNDVAAAAISGNSQSHLGEPRMRTLLERPGLGWLASRWSVRLVTGLLPRRHPMEWMDDRDAEMLAAEVCRSYLSTVTIVSALAPEYGFTPFFFWQPVLALTGKVRTPEEQSMAIGEANFVDLLSRVYTTIGEAATERATLEDLSAALDDLDSQIWIDEVHVTPEGNRHLAAAMADIIARRLELEAR